MNTGNVALVLNAHFPYVRCAGRWPHGEESLHEVIAESYVPLLVMLHDLRSTLPRDTPIPLTVALSPVLLEQLADPVIARHFTVWVDAWRGRAVDDLARFEAQHDDHAAYLARFYVDWIDSIRHNFNERFGRSLVGVLRSLLRESTELLLSPATYAYLPHLSPEEVRAQLETGALALLRHLGQRPTGIWLPGGGLPSNLRASARELGLRYAVGGPGRHTGCVRSATTLPLIVPDQSLAEHVVAFGVGYPGDGWYREFYQLHPTSAVKYWRVTGMDVPLGAKAWYDPYLAFKRVDEHARHFVQALRQHVHEAAARGSSTIVIAFDAELFGHWWFEGVRWLQHVLTHVLAADDLRLVTLQQVYESLPPLDDASLSHPTAPLFDNPSVAAMRERLKRASMRFAALIRARPSAEGLEDALLTQAARELVLAQSSDWPVLLASGAAPDYAQQRFDEHMARLERLLAHIEAPAQTTKAESDLREIAERDNPFPFINYRMFG